MEKREQLYLSLIHIYSKAVKSGLSCGICGSMFL